MTIPELVLPAGNAHKARTAFAYGADAVYVGMKSLSLRAGADNFSPEDLTETVSHAHAMGKRVYVALNAFMRDSDIDILKELLPSVIDANADAVIVSDPGAVGIVKASGFTGNIHLSTQANTMNSAAADFWQKQGVSRIVLARELSLEDITRVVESSAAQYEIFVHGAMCMSISGRCLLSAYFTAREANQGDCSHPCRWGWAIKEQLSPDREIVIEQDGEYSHLLNANDLCLIKRLPELLACGIHACKIEGRMRSEFFVATVTRIYRHALDVLSREDDFNQYIERYELELAKISHRTYGEGFLDGRVYAMQDTTGPSIRDWEIAAVIRETTEDPMHYIVEVKNRIIQGETVEVFGPDLDKDFKQKLSFCTHDNKDIEKAHPGTRVRIKFDSPVAAGYYLRRERTQ